MLEAGWDHGYDLAGNMSSVQSVTASGQPALVTRRGHNALNQITSWGGPGKTLVRGSIDEPGQVAIGAGGGGLKPARMLEGNRFEAELNLPAGPQALRVSATDPSGNTSNSTYQIQVAHAGARTFSHDTNGNLLSDGIRSYEWDSLSRLKKVTWDATRTTEFKYNALGQRSERIEKTGATTTAQSYYLFDGIELVNRYTGGTATGNIDRRYFNEGEQRKNGAAWDGFYYTRDHLGSIREVLASNGTLVARYDYDPYGKRTAQYQAGTYTNGCDLGFTGHVTLSSPVIGQVELVLTHFRAYDAELGRWLSADPIGEEGGVNLYGYVGGRVLNHDDRLGLYFGWDDGIFIGGGALLGLINQGVGDLIRGELSGIEDYGAAALGGAAGGATLLYTGNPIAAGAVSGAVTNLSRQGLKMASGKQDCFDVGSLAVETGIGALTGTVAGAKVPGLTSGRGNSFAQFKGIRTKAANGNLGWIDRQPGTAMNMFNGAMVGTAAVESSIAATSGASLADLAAPNTEGDCD